MSGNSWQIFLDAWLLKLGHESVLECLLDDRVGDDDLGATLVQVIAAARTALDKSLSDEDYAYVRFGLTDLCTAAPNLAKLIERMEPEDREMGMKLLGKALYAAFAIGRSGVISDGARERLNGEHARTMRDRRMEKAATKEEIISKTMQEEMSNWDGTAPWKLAGVISAKLKEVDISLNTRSVYRRIQKADILVESHNE